MVNEEPNDVLDIEIVRNGNECDFGAEAEKAEEEQEDDDDIDEDEDEAEEEKEDDEMEEEMEERDGGGGEEGAFDYSDEADKKRGNADEKEGLKRKGEGCEGTVDEEQLTNCEPNGDEGRKRALTEEEIEEEEEIKSLTRVKRSTEDNCNEDAVEKVNAAESDENYLEAFEEGGCTANAVAIEAAGGMPISVVKKG
eukprot:MONOS_511.1-p1 / transcript=MONOS_511.1 / gene=MONOS_511 / organism=Monocercomonoides_exilis_PA203 / gene_product=unspecified product / transcript_product=unspecified product / location=Mono_scaffold00008:105324-105911(-) / protein_length=196 / sequence_SO=supercontig / SO=protein_coding / is_pseudo=false